MQYSLDHCILAIDMWSTGFEGAVAQSILRDVQCKRLLNENHELSSLSTMYSAKVAGSEVVVLQASKSEWQ